MSIEQRGKNAWRIRVTYKGIQHIQVFYGTLREAKDAEAELKVEVKKGITATSRITLEKYVTTYYMENHYPTLADKTQVDYLLHINKRILPALGKYPLPELSPTIVEHFYSTLRRKGDSDRTVQKSAAILSSILTHAVQRHFISFNPCMSTARPKYKRSNDQNFLSTEEIELLLDQVRVLPTHKQVPIYIALYTGTRLGEACGITWDCVNFERKEIHINKTRKRIAGHGVVLGGTKNETSERYIAIPEALVNFLKDWRRTQSEFLETNGLPPAEYVITEPAGHPTDPTTVSKRFKQFAVNQLGKTDVTYHGLRHTFATQLLYASNVPEFSVTATLGHSNPMTHKIIYGHKLRTRTRDTADFWNQQDASREKDEQKQNDPGNSRESTGNTGPK